MPILSTYAYACFVQIRNQFLPAARPGVQIIFVQIISQFVIIQMCSLSNPPAPPQITPNSYSVITSHKDLSKLTKFLIQKKDPSTRAQIYCQHHQFLPKQKQNQVFCQENSQNKFEVRGNGGHHPVQDSQCVSKLPPKPS